MVKELYIVINLVGNDFLLFFIYCFNLYATQNSKFKV
jgi:hypothetical protein